METRQRRIVKQSCGAVMNGVMESVFKFKKKKRKKGYGEESRRYRGKEKMRGKKRQDSHGNRKPDPPQFLNLIQSWRRLDIPIPWEELEHGIQLLRPAQCSYIFKYPFGTLCPTVMLFRLCTQLSDLCCKES